MVNRLLHTVKCGNKFGFAVIRQLYAFYFGAVGTAPEHKTDNAGQESQESFAAQGIIGGDTEAAAGDGLFKAVKAFLHSLAVIIGFPGFQGVGNTIGDKDADAFIEHCFHFGGSVERVMTVSVTDDELIEEGLFTVG